MVNKKNLSVILLLFCLLLCGKHGNAYNKYSDTGVKKERMRLEDAILIAKQQSPQAKIAELNFMSQYWSYRSYKALLLPSFNLTSNLGNYNRSLSEIQDYETGDIKYIANNSMSNEVSFSINQKIALTGGNVSVNTRLYRLDQFDNDNKVLYNSNPISINYNQPLRSFNEFKWRKEIDPKEYENAKRQYLESMQTLNITVTTLFFNVISAQNDYKKAIENSEDTKRLYEIAQKRSEIGTIAKSELLQLELSVLNKDLAINNSKVALDIAIYDFCSYLGISKNMDIEFIPPLEVPSIEVDFNTVLEKANENSTFRVSQDIKLLNAAKSVAQAKANKGISVDLRMNVGFSQSGKDISEAYRKLKDQEIIGLSLNIPVCDWGMSKGQLKMAQARQRVVRTEVEQEILKFEQDIRIKVIKFNNQAEQCLLSEKAVAVAQERYAITLKHFENGSISVTDLNTAIEEYENSQNQYIAQLRSYWVAYYELQRLSLYDYINNEDISAEFDKIVK